MSDFYLFGYTPRANGKLTPEEIRALIEVAHYVDKHPALAQPASTAPYGRHLAEQILRSRNAVLFAARSLCPHEDRAVDEEDGIERCSDCQLQFDKVYVAAKAVAS